MDEAEGHMLGMVRCLLIWSGNNQSALWAVAFITIMIISWVI